MWVQKHARDRGIFDSSAVADLVAKVKVGNNKITNNAVTIEEGTSTYLSSSLQTYEASEKGIVFSFGRA